jgi:gliding motility-associated-like protein
MIKLSINTKYETLVFFSLLFTSLFYAQNQPPVLQATDKQAFCPGIQIEIAPSFTITDPDLLDIGVDNFSAQISSGYQANSDVLSLDATPYPSIDASWSPLEGKLTLIGIGGVEIPYSELQMAVRNIFFTTTATLVSDEKIFSLTIGDANYLPLTDHFYEFISEGGITWENAKIAAEKEIYFDRSGYLATLTSQEEADFAGKQASGAGWIGGSDEETEGVWKWVTGPEAGTSMANFWNGGVNGSTPNYANWNNNEPNNVGGNEDYAHITDPSIGIRGAWNDLPNEGGTNLYAPKGYIVEYGAPGDPVLNIAASTSIYIPQITSITEATICGNGNATISANSDEGEIIWYDALTGGKEVYRGNNFTTLDLNMTTVYYVLTSVNGCLSLPRTSVAVNVVQRPTITNSTDDLICSGSAILSAIPSAGIVNWYTSETSLTPVFSGNNFETLPLNTTTSYYVEANNSNCTSESRTEVKATVDATIPTFDLAKEVYFLCDIIGVVTLETNNALGNYRYIWKKDNSIIIGDLSAININESGNYSVKSVSLAGCESIEKQLVVYDSSIATITNDDLLLVDDSGNNSLEVVTNNLGTGNYEFSLDDEFGNYIAIGFFENISTGMHTLFVRDKGGCGLASYEFSILVYPKFFTPNGDGTNDVWKIDGFNKNFYTIANIYIYNRFGTLLFIIDQQNEGWNGTYQGKILPSSSYWFKTILTDINGVSVEKIGSFSLLRK